MMNPEDYQPIYLIVISLLCFLFSFRFALSPDFRYQEEKNSSFLSIMLALLLSVWLGTRPVSLLFGDTFNYAVYYDLIDWEGRFNDLNLTWNSEYIWILFTFLCKKFDLGITAYFTIIEFAYIFFSLWAVRKFTPYNSFVGFLFVCASLMFFSFATNGLRNGVACQMTLVAMAYFLDRKFITAIIISILAIEIHFAVVLPIVAIVICLYAFKNYRYAIVLWICSIVISLILGSRFAIIADYIPMDDRISQYLTGENIEADLITGFRLDFLIYSAPPIVLAWYVIIKRRITDSWYIALSSAYCICNAAWVIIIRAAYSNRFAYLSWFMYPILIAYPLLNMPIWKKQDRKIALALTLYMLFTLFMQVLVWKNV